MSQAEDAFLRFIGNSREEAQIEEGNFFGFRATKAKGKTFVILSGKHLVFRLPTEASQEALALAGSEMWNPYGREKRYWIQIPAEHAEQWEHFFDEALRFAAE